MDGIGDTIRVSLSSDPVDEIKAGYEILKSLGIRARGVNIISCPSCARQAFPVIETVKARDYKDSTRLINPLRKAESATEIDVSNLSIEEVYQKMITQINYTIRV